MKKIIALVLSVAVIVLELLPFGAVLRFASPNPDKLTIKAYSYFSPVPYGYANFGPMLTAILSVVLLIAVIIFLFKNSGLMIIKIVSAIAVFTSVLPIIMHGLIYFTLTGAAITLLLLAECILAFSFAKKPL